jgi:hypothetical protein
MDTEEQLFESTEQTPLDFVCDLYEERLLQKRR